MQYSRDFKGIWIPREIWLDRRLNAMQKSLWAEIHSLHDRKRGGCYASNEYLCNFMGITVRPLQDSLKKLKDFGFLEMFMDQSGIRILRAISPTENANDLESTPTTPPPKTAGGGAENSGGGTLKTAGASYIENKEENKDKKDIAAGAAIDCVDPDHSISISKEIIDLSNSIIECLKINNPMYKPVNPRTIAKDVAKTITDSKCKPSDVLAVVEWTATNHFWAAHLYKKRNVGSYLREKFAQLYAQMNSKPPEMKRLRKFAPDSDDAKAMARMQEMSDRAIY